MRTPQSITFQFGVTGSNSLCTSRPVKVPGGNQKLESTYSRTRKAARDSRRCMPGWGCARGRPFIAAPEAIPRGGMDGLVAPHRSTPPAICADAGDA